MSLRDIIPFKKKNSPMVRENDDPFSLLRRRMDEIFEDFLGYPEGRKFGASLNGFRPDADIVENDGEIKVSVELPGMDEKDIEVSIDRDSLVLRGEKREEKTDNAKGYYRMERTYGSFMRAIPLPAEIDQNKVNASFKKGVLTIRLPKSETALSRTKKIPISAG